MSDNKALADRLNEAWTRLYAEGDEYGLCDTLHEAAAALSPQADKARGEVDGQRIKRAMMTAHAYLPDSVLGHPKRMQWMGERFLAELGLAAPQPQGDASPDPLCVKELPACQFPKCGCKDEQAPTADGGAAKMISEVEDRVRAKMMGEAVTMSSSGRLRVDPRKVYVSREDGLRALDQLRNLARSGGLDTDRRMAAVQTLIDLGWQWRDGQWVQPNK